MYWSALNGTRLLAIGNIMHVNRFFKLHSYLHLLDTDSNNGYF